MGVRLHLRESKERQMPIAAINYPCERVVEASKVSSTSNNEKQNLHEYIFYKNCVFCKNIKILAIQYRKVYNTIL